ncbi:MAG: hypothetical protein GY906_23970 [bacterium]|nr:hypothetical protein [bacterium]
MKGRDLAGYAVAQGVWEGIPAAVMQKIGLGGVESAFGKRAVSKGVREGLKRLGYTALQELPEELVTELGHNVAAALAGVDPEAMSKEAIWQTVTDTTVQTLMTVLFVGGPGVGKAYDQGKAARVSTEMGEYAKEGKVPSRKTWKKWGLAPELGESRAQRKAWTETVTKLIDQVGEQMAAEEGAQQAPAAPTAPPVAPGAAPAPELRPAEEALDEAPAEPGPQARKAPVEHRAWSDMEGEEGYVYHATNEDNAAEIIEGKLDPHGPSYGTDQETWPDGSEELRSYFTEHPATAFSFAPAEGKPLLTRVKKAAAPFLKESTGDTYTKGSIDPANIEVATEGGWVSLNEYMGKPATKAKPAPPKVRPEAKPAPPKAKTVLSEAERKTQAAYGMKTHDFTTEAQGTGKRVSGREVVRRMERIWGTQLRLGRMGKYTGVARGIYKRFGQLIRLGRGEEASIAVAAHEIAHHMDETTDVLKDLSLGAKMELGELDYDQELVAAGKGRRSEGIAEYVRGMITGSTQHIKGIDLKEKAPHFTEEFAAWLKKNPEVMRNIQESLRLTNEYRNAGALGRVKGAVSKTGRDITDEPLPLRKRMSNLWNFMYWKVKEQGLPISKYSKETQKIQAKRPGYQPGSDTTAYEDFNALRQAGPHFAGTALEDGVFSLVDKNGKGLQKLGPSLKEALTEIKEGDDYDGFIAWMYSRHAIESWSKGKDPGVTLTDAKYVFENHYDARYEKAANTVTEYNNALIDMIAETGVIDEATATRMKEFYKYYVPLERAKKGAALGGVHSMVNLGKAFKGRHGSSLQILDPLETTVARTIRLYERAAKQIVIQKILKTSQDVRAMGKWVEEVPTKVMKEHFSFAQIKAQLENAMDFGGASEEEIDELLSKVDPTLMLSIWKPDLMTVKGDPIVRVTIDGQPRFFYLDEQLWESLGGLDVQQNLGMVTRVVKSANFALKLGATRLNPDFVLTNAFRDFQSFLMQGEKGLKGAFDPAAYAVSYIWSELKQAAGGQPTEITRLWNTMGGPLGTYIGLDRNSLKKGVDKNLRGRSSWLETGMNIAGTPEVASRLAEFAAVLDRLGWLDRAKKGETPPMHVLVKAINASHDVTVDFRRMGAWGRYLNYYIPFFNANLEGLDKTVRTFKDHKVRTTMRVVMQRVPLALTYWWYRHKDDDYEERPEWLDKFWVFTDKKGNPLHKIPKQQTWGLIDSGIERMMDAMYDKDPKAVTRWFKQVASETLLPNRHPALFTPLFETMFNYDSFRDRPIVSLPLQGLENVDQSYEYTSKLAQQAAQFLSDYSGGRINLSPAKMDHLTNGLSGGLYRKVTEPVTKVVEGTGWARSDVPGLKGVTMRKDYAKSTDDFYTRAVKLSKLHESNKHRAKLGKSTKPEDLAEWRKSESVKALMTAVRKAVYGAPSESRLLADRAMVGLARQALGRTPLDRYENPMEHLDGLPGVVKAAIEDHIGRKAVTATRISKDPDTLTKGHEAAEYLWSMGVTLEDAQSALYARLRSQGMSSKGAGIRQDRLKRTVWMRK